MKRKVTDLKPSEAIMIKNDAEQNAILQLMEDAGINWFGGDLPTSFNPIKAGAVYPYFIVSDEIGLHWTQEIMATYPATDFIGSDGTMERGITIVKQNGKVISGNELIVSEPDNIINITLPKFDQAIKLLRDLADLQNGAPLEQHRAEWEQTMDEVYTFLNEHEPRNTQTNEQR